jgi:hypothetical protein
MNQCEWDVEEYPWRLGVRKKGVEWIDPLEDIYDMPELASSIDSRSRHRNGDGQEGKTTHD